MSVSFTRSQQLAGGIAVLAVGALLAGATSGGTPVRQRTMSS